MQTSQRLESLIIHPALEAIPVLGEEEPASRAMVASVCEIGILESLKVNKGRVVDGRLRMRGAKAAGLESVPTEEVAEENVNSILLHSLAARKHYTKGQLAYLTFPIMESVLVETRKRRLEAAKLGASASLPKSNFLTYRNTIEEIAEQLGLSRAVFFESKAIRKKFSMYPKLRAEWEPKILSGEMRLDQVMHALSGKIAALENKTHPKNDPAQLTLELFETSATRLGRWEELTASQKEEATKAFREKCLEHLPDDLIKETEKWLRGRKVRFQAVMQQSSAIGFRNTNPEARAADTQRATPAFHCNDRE